jgi:hypothetical protein
MSYSVDCRNKGTSSSLVNVERYVIVRNLPDFIFNVPPVLICRWEIRTRTGFFLRRVAYARHDVTLLVELMEFSKQMRNEDEVHIEFCSQRDRG